MNFFSKNAIIAAMGLSLTGLAGAYDVVGGYVPNTNNASKPIIWRYHNCEMNTSTGSTGDDGTAFFNQLQDGRIPTTGTAVPCYASSFNTTNTPLTAPNTLDQLRPKIAFTLQESRHIDKSNVQLSNDDQTNIYVAANKSVKVWATFMDEGAGYENSVGFFTWAGGKDNKPSRTTDGLPMLANGELLNTEKIILPRTSTTFPLPRSAKEGTTVYLGEFNGGTSGLGIGFMVAANGWSGTARGTNPNKGGVNPNRDKSWIFYSVKKMNPECVGLSDAQCKNLDQHTILLFDEEVTGTDNQKYQRVVLGIEDLKRTGGDHDFNDVLLAIHIKESETGAFNNKGDLPGIAASTDPDTDKDGVKDSLDEFPLDATRTYSRYYPGKSSWGTLAYEDLWPSKGDYDFNDMLLRYRSREILNANRAVVALEMDFRLDAAGAGHRNGFAINLPSVAANNIQSATLTGSRRNKFSDAPIPLTANDLFSSSPLLDNVTGGQNGSVFQIFQDAKKLIHPDNGSAGGTNSLYNTATCTDTGFRNTGKDCAKAPPAEFKLAITFKTSIPSFPLPPYDPFLFRANAASNSGVLGTAVEVHLPGKLPTSRADTKIFGTGIDRTPTNTTPNTVTPGNTYISNSKLPWALDIPAEWDYAYEKLDITGPYPNIIPWAQSGGKTNTNWFTAPANNGSGTFKENAKTISN